MKSRTIWIITLLAIITISLLFNSNVSPVSGQARKHAEELKIRLAKSDLPVKRVQVLNESPLHIEVTLIGSEEQMNFDAAWARFLTEYETKLSLGEWLTAGNQKGLNSGEILALYDVVFVDIDGVEIDKATEFLYADSVMTVKDNIEFDKRASDSDVQTRLRKSFNLSELSSPNGLEIESKIATISISVDSNSKLSGSPRFLRMKWESSKDVDLLTLFRLFGGSFSAKYADLEIDFVRIHVVDDQGEWLADYGGNFNMNSYLFRLSDELANLSMPPSSLP